jgi:hypothetical protein
VLCFNAADQLAVAGLLDRYGLSLRLVPPHEQVPGSYWGDPEAGLVGDNLFARFDTPVHSILHEAAHFACMAPERRTRLDTDAGGEDAEENAVCCLQILLAQRLAGIDGERMCQDMDSWGYTFRLGSAKRWFAEDAHDAKHWLLEHGLIDEAGVPTFHCR